MDTDTAKGNTPISDRFAYGRAVDPEAIALMRQLERDRAELLAIITQPGHGPYVFAPPHTIRQRVTKFPLDKV